MTSKSIYQLISAALIISFAGTACKDDVILPDQPLSNYEKVYMPQAVDNPVRYTFNLSDNPDTIIYGADYGGYNYPTQDIPVTFGVNASVIDSFNQANNTNYTLLPATGYELTGTSAIIPKGQLATEPQILKIHSKGMDAFTEYLLPVSIMENKSSTQTSETLGTTFFVIRSEPNLADYSDYDRSAWTVTDFSTEEPAEGNGNGLAMDVLDNNTGTFWQTRWASGEPGPPHYITIDMGTTQMLHGVSIMDRNFSGSWQTDGHGQPKTIVVAVSTDGSTWTDVGTLENIPHDAGQPWYRLFVHKFMDARYFRLTVTEVYGTPSTNIAEVGAF